MKIERFVQRRAITILALISIEKDMLICSKLNSCLSILNLALKAKDETIAERLVRQSDKLYASIRK